MGYLLDSDACIAVLRGRAGVLTKLAAITPDSCAISSISVYELFIGVAKCRQPERERAKIEALLGSLQVIEFDRIAAQCAAVVRVHLESVGTPIGPYDTLLAGQALAEGLTLVTANVSEFSRVTGLTIENWLV